jgi:hypothetical protein
MDTPTRRADAVIYMPQDALITPTLTFNHQYEVGYTWYNVTVVVYRSARLGHMLPALDFQDGNGNPLPSGTLFLDQHIGSD